MSEQKLWAPLTVEQLVGRLDIKCDEIMTRSRPTKSDVNGLVGLCRRLISALEEEKACCRSQHGTITFCDEAPKEGDS